MHLFYFLRTNASWQNGKMRDFANISSHFFPTLHILLIAQTSSQMPDGNLAPEIQIFNFSALIFDPPGQNAATAKSWRGLSQKLQ